MLKFLKLSVSFSILREREREREVGRKMLMVKIYIMGLGNVDKSSQIMDGY